MVLLNLLIMFVVFIADSDRKYLYPGTFAKQKPSPYIASKA